jgi:hypothetical protein
MAWWPLWGAHRGQPTTTKDANLIGSVSLGVGRSGLGSTGLGATLETVARPEVPVQRAPDGMARPETMRRIADALDRREIRSLTDGDGSLLRHLGAARAALRARRP